MVQGESVELREGSRVSFSGDDVVFTVRRAFECRSDPALYVDFC